MIKKGQNLKRLAKHIDVNNVSNILDSESWELVRNYLNLGINRQDLTKKLKEIQRCKIKELKVLEKVLEILPKCPNSPNSTEEW